MVPPVGSPPPVPSATPAPRRRGRLEAALVHLVRLVLDEEWSAPTAAARLVDAVGGDPTVLRRTRARVLDRTAGTTGVVAERAIATLDLALRTTSRP